MNLWKAPTEISDRLTTNNLVLDSLSALHEKRGDSVKILFDCSYRDDTLKQYQSYIDSGKMDKTKELGDNFQRDLKEEVRSKMKTETKRGHKVLKIIGIILLIIFAVALSMRTQDLKTISQEASW